MLMDHLNFTATKIFAQACTESNFLGIKPWYQYIKRAPINGYCTLDFQSQGVGTVWLVLAGILDILLRLGTMVAVAFFIFGAIKMITSQGSPDQIKSARNTMVNAVVGLVICVVATWVTAFLMETVIL